MKVEADPDALRELARRCLETADTVTEAQARLWNGVQGEVLPRWRDDRAQDLAERLIEAVQGVPAAMARLRELGTEVTGRATVLDGYGAVWAPSGGGATAAAPTPAPAPPFAVTGSVRGRAGELALVSFAGVRPEDVDWASGNDFPARFPGDVHHGNDATQYRAWTAAAGRVVAAVRGGHEVTEADRNARDVYLGSEPVRLVMQKNGRYRAETQHRVMAAIEAQATIPVRIERE